MTGPPRLHRAAFACLLLASVALPAALMYQNLRGLVNSDITHMHYPPWAESQRAWRDGEIPLWTPHWISGYPLVASAESRIFEPLSFLLLPLGGPEAWRHRILVSAYYLLAGLTAFLYLRRIGLGKAAALLGALLFEYGIQTDTGLHPSPMGFRYFLSGWFYLPLLWWGIEGLLERGRGRDLALLGAAYGAALLSVNPQYMIYLSAASVGYQLVRGLGRTGMEIPGWKRAVVLVMASLAAARIWTPLAWGAVAGILALAGAALCSALGSWRGALGSWRDWLWLPLGWALASPQLVFDIPFTLDSPRLHDATRWSQFAGLESLASIAAFARYVARGGVPEISLSMGLSAFCLTGYALWKGPGRARCALAIAAGTLAFLGLSRVVFIGSMDQGRLRPVFDLGMAVMAASGFQALSLAPRRWQWAGAGIAALDLLLDPRHYGHYVKLALNRLRTVPEPAAFVLADVLLLGMVFLFLAGRKRPGTVALLLPIWAAVALHSLRPPLKPPQATPPKDQPYVATPVEFLPTHVTAFLKSKPGSRMHAEMRGGHQPVSAMAAAAMAAGLEPLSGGDPMYVRRFGELFSDRLYMGWDRPLTPDLLPLLSLMNVRFVVLPHGQPPMFEPFERVLRSPSGDVYENPRCLPRAFLVGSSETVEPRAGILRMRRADFDPLAAVLLEEPDPQGPLPPGPASGHAEVRMPTRRSARIEVESDREAYLVWSMVHCPGWHARIDGRKVPVLRAYHALQAVRVPAGRHTVEFSYLPARVWVSAGIATAALCAILALLLPRR